MDKRDVQGDGPFPDGINVTIRRNYIYEDAYDKLSPENGESSVAVISVKAQLGDCVCVCVISCVGLKKSIPTVSPMSGRKKNVL